MRDSGVFHYLLYVGVAVISILSSNCSFKKTASEKPYASEARVSRAFFETTGKNGQAVLKTFLAGWAPDSAAGDSQQEIFMHYNHAGHANIVFEITEDMLLGRLVNPSFITNTQDCLDRDSEAAKACRARWKTVVTIPIRNHFYYERKKDSRGRETDEFIENDSRSHWSARPYMNLSLSGVNIKDWAMAMANSTLVIDSVEDIEWDYKKSFLGFTVGATSPAASWWGADAQGKFRFNFLEFQHDSKFTKTHFSPQNAKYLNVLHVIGSYIGGDYDNPVMYGAHWNTKVKHEISLFNFPKEYEKIGLDIIDQWNDAFEKVGHGRPFVAKVSERKYAFDLRYPTINWISDRRLSSSAPLGVGMALADVRNGEIKWGMVSVWGGQLEEIINYYAPNSGSAPAAMVAGDKSLIQLGLMEPKRLLPTTRSSVPPELTSMNSFDAIKNSLNNSFAQEAKGLQQISQQINQATPEMLQKIREDKSEFNPLRAMLDEMGIGSASNEEALKMLKQRKSSIDQMLDVKSQILNDMSSQISALGGNFQQMALQNGSTEKIYNSDYIQNLIGQPTVEESLNQLPVFNRAGLFNKINQKQSVSRKEMINMLNEMPQTSAEWAPAAFDADRNFSHMADGWAMAMGEYNIDKREALRSTIKNLLLHEVGHMLGLGHNFKENILPERGTLPNVSSKIGWMNSHKHQNFSMEKLENDAQNEYRNYTTVMGYMSGQTEIALKYEELAPGPADILSLHYLYNQQYPIYPLNANGQGDIDFEKVKNDGLIRETVNRNGKIYTTAYFPACNDFYASMGMDPYCNRWDRGYNASTLMDNYFESFKGNLVSSLNAFSNTVKGGAFWASEGRLWSRSLDTMSRVRVFYDYMRQKYDKEIRSLVFNGSDEAEQNLLDFSETCQKVAKGQKTSNPKLEALFKQADKKELLDLCVANAKLVAELESLMQLPGKDYSQVDYMDKYMSYISGGDGSTAFSRAFGSWKELARTPIKLSSLMTLTSPYPFNFRNGWVWPIEQYSREDGSYHLSTLYPKEYTSAIASATEMNLSFGDSAIDQKTSIGKTVLAMGYYLYNSAYSNDALSVSAPFIENIRNQTRYRYGWVIVDVERKDEDNKEIARKFFATVHNTNGNTGPETVPEFYIFKGNRTVMMPPPRSLLLPVSQIRWYTKSKGYFAAMKMDYADDYYDRFKSKSVRKSLEDQYYEIMKKCVQGPNRNGLRDFFNDSVEESIFPGFTFPATISDNTTDLYKFFDSVEEQYRRYYADPKLKADPALCEEALRGQALLVMAASVMNGYYLYNVTDYIQKGQ